MLKASLVKQAAFKTFHSEIASQGTTFDPASTTEITETVPSRGPSDEIDGCCTYSALSGAVFIL